MVPLLLRYSELVQTIERMWCETSQWCLQIKLLKPHETHVPPQQELWRLNIVKKWKKKVTGACEMHNAFLTKTRKVRYFETKVHNVAQAGLYNMNGYRSNINVDNIRAQSATQHYPLINQTLKE